jgi:hypothetical protein
MPFGISALSAYLFWFYMEFELSSGMYWCTHPWWWRQYVPLKRRSTIILRGSTSQKTFLNVILAAVRTWNLLYRVCLTTHFRQQRLYRVGWKGDKWEKNWKGCGRKRSWPNLRYYPSIFLQGLRKNMRRSVISYNSKNFAFWSQLWRLEPTCLLRNGKSLTLINLSNPRCITFNK